MEDDDDDTNSENEGVSDDDDIDEDNDDDDGDGSEEDEISYEDENENEKEIMDEYDYKKPELDLDTISSMPDMIDAWASLEAQDLVDAETESQTIHLPGSASKTRTGCIPVSYTISFHNVCAVCAQPFSESAPRVRRHLPGLFIQMDAHEACFAM